MGTKGNSFTGNKGEWSEIYTLFKLLGDKNLYGGDSNLNRIESLLYPIIKIIRDETNGTFEYGINGDLVFITGGKEKIRIPVKRFSEEAARLLTKIKKSKGSFECPYTADFMDSINCDSLKSKPNAKTDIRIVVHDIRLSQAVELGFSIKSQLGGDSTLLNAGKTTNFIYRVEGLNVSQAKVDNINEIETRSKIKDRLLEVFRFGGKLRFDDLENHIFKNNLILIDSLLPNILAEVLIVYFTSQESTIKEIVDKISIENPMGFDNKFSHGFYEYKIKRFLTDVALGMMPSKVWGGSYEATGGFLIVKDDGEVLCYHIYNRNQFEDYLYQNTRLETASSTRHDFGKVYTSKNKLNIKLNLQIRFV